MKFNKEIFRLLVEKIGSESGVYSAIRRKEKKFRAASPESIFYLIAANNCIKISKYVKDPQLLQKIEELIEKDKEDKPISHKKEIIIKKIKDEDPYNFPLSKFNVDNELVNDCKIAKPYRGCIREALLTLETKIKKKLNINKNGKALITECKNKGVFKRQEASEEEGLYFLFTGVIEWLRNPPSHNKIHYTKEDAIKIILFTDYLIRLFYDLCNENKIN